MHEQVYNIFSNSKVTTLIIERTNKNIIPRLKTLKIGKQQLISRIDHWTHQQVYSILSKSKVTTLIIGSTNKVIIQGLKSLIIENNS